MKFLKIIVCFLGFTAIAFLFSVWVITELETVREYHPIYTPELVRFLPEQLMIQSARDIYQKGPIDDSEQWVRMTLAREDISQLTKSLKPVQKVALLSERHQRGICEGLPNWWRRDMCDKEGSTFKFFHITIPPRYPAGTIHKEIVVIHTESNTLYLYEK